MLPSEQPDRIHVALNDDYTALVDQCWAPLLTRINPRPAAMKTGVELVAQPRTDLGDAPGRANPGDKMLTLVASALAGGDCRLTTPTCCAPAGRLARLGCVVRGALHLEQDVPAQLPVGPRAASWIG